ncbi:hypothetical protein [Paenibacillus tengchongensis]|uniref:hypothetical protein n=1 Tax=Paenibacillus tengchongensis TaxID=2608684 RepID=UPI00124D44B4|nr:hypothetical protein [Paenibacillus tengchongensis]
MDIEVIKDIFVRLIGAGIIFQSIRFLFGRKIVLQKRYSRETVTLDDSTPRPRNLFRVGGVFGLFLGALTIYYGMDILDVLFPWMTELVR